MAVSTGASSAGGLMAASTGGDAGAAAPMPIVENNALKIIARRRREELAGLPTSLWWHVCRQRRESGGPGRAKRPLHDAIAAPARPDEVPVEYRSVWRQ